MGRRLTRRRRASASSFHAWWSVPRRLVVTSAQVGLEIVEPPVVHRLYFWALQVGFTDERGGRHGGAHLGLQWNPRHPGSTAVNWGGYDAGGDILDGTESPLPSTPGDPNTRDLPWRAGEVHTLSIRPGAEPGAWVGSIEWADGGSVDVRALAAGGDRLVSPVVWSEIFADCDDPGVMVRWTDPSLDGPAGGARIREFRLTYQAERDGGCTNTVTWPEEGSLMQATHRTRTTPDGATVRLAG